ncbi:MAG: hypothetical protein H8E51_03380 [Bacteroidetes bacterium]|nr:hypothetical protein [Bacteroidota bacterium]
MEGSFLAAILNKFIYGGWFTFLLGSLLFVVMFVCFYFTFNTKSSP